MSRVQDCVLLSLTESDGLVLHLAPLRIMYSPEWLGDFLDWLLPLLAGGAVTPQVVCHGHNHKHGHGAVAPEARPRPQWH